MSGLFASRLLIGSLVIVTVLVVMACLSVPGPIVIGVMAMLVGVPLLCVLVKDLLSTTAAVTAPGWTLAVIASGCIGWFILVAVKRML